MSEHVDIVITWVDDHDENWLREKDEYLDKVKNPEMIDAGIERYRDWGLLKYWFRSIEKNAGWVRKIFFVTSGCVPSCLTCQIPGSVL